MTDRNEKEAIKKVVLVWLCAALVYFLLSFCLTWITWGGEGYYFSSADSLLNTGRFLYQGAFNESTPPLYPAAIAPAFFWKDIFTVSALARLLNSLYLASVVFPVFMLARTIMPPHRALMVAILSTAFGEIYYSAFFIAENIYFPLVYWTLLALRHFLVTRGWKWASITVLALISIYLTKASGLALILGICLSCATVFTLDAFESPKMRDKPFFVSPLFFAATGIALLILMLLILRALHSGYWTVFVDSVTAFESLRYTHLLNWEARFAGQLGLMTGGGMLALALPSLLMAMQPTAERHVRILAIVSVWVLLSVLTMAAWFNGYLYGWLVERHIFWLLPLVAMWAAANNAPRSALWAGIVVPPLLLTLFFVPEYEFFAHWSDVLAIDELWVRGAQIGFTVAISVSCLTLAYRGAHAHAFGLAATGWLVCNLFFFASASYLFYGRETAMERQRDQPVVKRMCELIDAPANLIFQPNPGHVVLKDRIIKDYLYFCRDYSSLVNSPIMLSDRQFYAIVEAGAALPRPDHRWDMLENLNGVTIYRALP